MTEEDFIPITGESAQPLSGGRIDDERSTALHNVVDHLIIPRLALQQPNIARPGRFGTSLSENIPTVTEFALSSDLDRSERVLRRLQGAGASFADLQLGLLAPAARRLGAMWQNDEITFFDVSLAAGRLRHMMRFVALDLFTEAAGGGFRHAILVAPAPGETHTLGATMAAEFFRRDHWHVTLEPKCSKADLARTAGSQHFDVLGLSITSVPDVKALADTICDVRAASANPKIFVIIGGDAVARDAGLVAELGADATLAALEFAPSRAHRLVDALFGPNR